VQYISFDWWMCAFVVFGLAFPYKAKRLAWGTFLKLPILHRVWRKTLTQSIQSSCNRRKLLISRHSTTSLLDDLRVLFLLLPLLYNDWCRQCYLYVAHVHTILTFLWALHFSFLFLNSHCNHFPQKERLPTAHVERNSCRTDVTKCEINEYLLY